MKLFHSATSPYVRTVMILLHEVGAADQVDLIPASGTPLDPGTAPIDLNPLGKVPTLALSDGSVFYDSRTICRYLANRYQPSLYPENGQDWPVVVLEATANGMMDATYLMVSETRLRPEDKQFAPWVEGQWEKIVRALDALEPQAQDPLFTGPIHIGHLALASALGYLDLRMDAREWRKGRPMLTEWYAQMAARPSLKATQPPQ